MLKIESQAMPKAILAIWCLLLSVVVINLMAKHWIPLPHPSANDSDWQRSSYTKMEWTGSGRWQVFHILADGCPCSDRILSHLQGRPQVDDVDETIVFMSDEPDEIPTTIHGYNVDVVSSDELLKKYGVESVPLLLVYDAKGLARYAGGYTARKQGFDIRDQQIIVDLQHGKKVAELPVFGCSISARLKSDLSILLR
jgi:hypothetical protein